jgi:hypothetical protein
VRFIGGRDIPSITSSTSPHPSHRTKEPKAFLALVQEIEDADFGETLRGKNRDDCLERFLYSARAFAIVLRRAIEQGSRSKIGMLVWKVRAGEVEKTERALARADKEGEVQF